ncbi:Hypothetical protein R9X50_00136100 [Acrodontium crateriforme]|uniref:Uncharacterized protein n=1 Tax=Acrodontium crateriforme TaxID=150365 RepID=A0AAQ3LZ73_9PEZI|nr:Hypothetical protein R9X50_00136100 [Acrodontium crateriforme]
MRIAALLALPAWLASTVHASPPTQPYDEQLHLAPLPGGNLYAGFSFTATTPLTSYDEQHFRYFPRALGQILQYTHTKELHLRFARGRWDDESWGTRPRGGRREGGTGVEIWAWVERGQEPDLLQERWSGLVNSLSGLFCASLNFIDGAKTSSPVVSFEPEGTHLNLDNLDLLHGTLPNEVVCTENLTPFLKLLPCKGKAGISSLLDGHKIFDANWQTMSIDVRPVCSAPDDCVLEIQQTVDIVLDIQRSMRPRDNPIPRPVPIEKIPCDETKEYNAEDTCYPKKFEGEMFWSLSKVFGQPIQGNCPLAEDGTKSYEIKLEVPFERTVEVITDGNISETKDQSERRYSVPEQQTLDISLPEQVLEVHTAPDARSPFDTPRLYASRQITGYGQQRGGMHAVLTNPQPYAQKIIYLESLPWFLRPFMHTLTFRASSGAEVRPEKMYYTPALDRKRGTQLELQVEVPAHSTVELSYEFEKAILRYTEYPPDANRGFDVPAAVVRVIANTTEADQDAYLRTTSLLLPLPTPDFSMPYNVIILTSTVIALGFGSIFNLLVRRFALASEVPPSPFATKLKAVRDRIRGLVQKAPAAKDGGETKDEKKVKGLNGKRTVDVNRKDL